METFFFFWLIIRYFEESGGIWTQISHLEILKEILIKLQSS